MTTPVHTLAGEIRAEHEAAQAAFGAAVGHAIRAGQLLTAAKAQLAHGEWLGWLGENFPASTRTAQGYMRLAARAEDAQRLAHLGVAGALRELAERPRADQAPDPEPDREAALLLALRDEPAYAAIARLAPGEIPALEEMARTVADRGGPLRNGASEVCLRAERKAGQLLNAQAAGRLLASEPRGDTLIVLEHWQHLLRLPRGEDLAEIRMVCDVIGVEPLIEHLDGRGGIEHVWLGHIDGDTAHYNPGWLSYCRKRGGALATGPLAALEDAEAIIARERGAVA